MPPILNSEQRAQAAALERSKAQVSALKAQTSKTKAPRPPKAPGGDAADFLSRLEVAEKRDQIRSSTPTPAPVAKLQIADAPTGGRASRSSSPRPASPQASKRSTTSSADSRRMSSSEQARERISAKLDRLSQARKRAPSPHNKPAPAPSPPPSAKRAASQAAAESMMPADLMVKGPGELRKEVLALRLALQEATADAQRANEAREEAQRATEEQAAAQEERFDDMCQFLEGLLKNLKAENGHLRQQLSERQEQHELDEFLSLEASSSRDGPNGMEASDVSSPLREARMHRFVFVDDDDDALDDEEEEGDDDEPADATAEDGASVQAYGPAPAPW